MEERQPPTPNDHSEPPRVEETIEEFLDSLR
jgi:hypothetical protein